VIQETFVITGGTGRVGAKVSDGLLRAARRVRIVARGRERLAAFAERGVETAAGTLLDVDFLAEAYRGATAVLTMLPLDYGARDLAEYQRRARRRGAAGRRAAGRALRGRPPHTDDRHPGHRRPRLRPPRAP
jgi:uncharacterized protein YbjT (DUF2867 family)